MNESRENGKRGVRKAKEEGRKERRKEDRERET